MSDYTVIISLVALVVSILSFVLNYSLNKKKYRLALDELNTRMESGLDPFGGSV